MPEHTLPAVRLLQLISPNLPVGAFTYSQGMEWAVECDWVTDRLQTREWLMSVMRDSLQVLELPILLRLYKSAKKNNFDEFRRWSQHLYASRETLELRKEEKQRARALFTVLKNLPDSNDWKQLHKWQEALLITQLAGFALAACRWKISLADVLQGYAWSWLENAVAVAVKLVPLGQSDGQSLLYQLSMQIGNMVEYACELDDEMLGASTTALAIASSLHETQYTRLFRS